MRLLWLKSDYLMPLDSGGKIRTYNLLRELNRLCEVTYVSFKSSRRENDEPLMRECASRILTLHRPEEDKSGAAFYFRVLRRMLSDRPYIVQKYRSDWLRAQQQLHWSRTHRGTDREPMVIVCDFLEMTDNVDWSLPCPKILFQHNVESIIWRRYWETELHPLRRAYFKFEHRRMSRYEGSICNRFDVVLTVSQQDKQTLEQQLGVTRPVAVIETAVDTHYFQPRPEITPVSGRLLFLGSLDWMPNIDGLRWFITEVYPRLRDAHPTMSLQIVGRRPVPSIVKLAAQDASIELVPDVEDVRPYIAAADLFIVPLRIGGGTRIKIYEAMAMGRPVVSTNIGAEALPLIHGQHIGLANQQPGAFATEVSQLLNNPSHKEEIARNGLRLVSENFQWKKVAKKFYNLCQASLDTYVDRPIGKAS